MKQQFIGYMVGGSDEHYLAMIDGGVDYLEIGIPFSDPVGEGVVIQEGMKRALAAGETAHTVLDRVARLRQKTATPMLLMGYYNPILQAGNDYYRQAAEAGASGLLIVDLPPDEAAVHVELCRQYGLKTVFLASPSTSSKRLNLIEKSTTGFVYYMCQKGTTGMRKELPDDLREHLTRIKKTCHLPIAVGFGIADKESAKQVLQLADGFVVGSLFVDLVNQGKPANQLKSLVASIDPRG